MFHTAKKQYIRYASFLRAMLQIAWNSASVVLQNSCNLLKFFGHFSSHFTIEPCKLNGLMRTLSPLILVRIQVPQPLIL
jgi:hypothetical protein